MSQKTAAGPIASNNATIDVTRMVLIPDPSDPTLDAIDRAMVEKRGEEPRAYFGVSNAGVECRRKAWLSWRWAEHDTMSAQSIKAIEDGHRGEALQAERLRMVPGIELHTVDADGKQFAVSALGGHLQGHMDGAIRGLLQAPKTWHCWEHKQCNEKKFEALKKLKRDHGEKAALEKWDFIFYVQAQLYMHLAGLTRHYLTCGTPGGRDTTACRTEYDAEKAKRLMSEAESIIFAAEPPERISEDPNWFECKFCPFHSQCHETAAPLTGCRTCAHATVEHEGGKWTCGLTHENLDVEFQRLGCESHVYIPRLIERFAELENAEGDRVTWRNKLTGKLFRQPEYRSIEIRAAEDKRLLGDEGVDKFKGVFGPVRIVNSGPVKPQVECLYWQTFANMTRHIRKEVNGRFAGYVPQTPEVVERMKTLGDPVWTGDEFSSDLPWGNNGQDTIASADAGDA